MLQATCHCPQISLGAFVLVLLHFTIYLLISVRACRRLPPVISFSLLLLFIFNNAVYNRLASTCFWQAKKIAIIETCQERRKEVGPSPADGPLRPIVCCTTQQHNRQVRAGRGVNLAGFD